MRLDELLIDVPHRGRGLGSAVVRGVIEVAEARGLPLRLTVAYASRARELFERLGLWITNLDGSVAHMEWARHPDLPFEVLDEVNADYLEELRRDLLDDAKRQRLGILEYLLCDAIGGSRAGLTPDGLVWSERTYLSPTTAVVRGAMASLEASVDPFSATIELADDQHSIVAFTMRWGDAETGLGAASSIEQPPDPRRVTDWLYVFHWACRSDGESDGG